MRSSVIQVWLGFMLRFHFVQTMIWFRTKMVLIGEFSNTDPEEVWIVLGL